MLQDKQKNKKILFVFITFLILVTFLYCVTSFFVRPNVGISITEGAVTSTEEFLSEQYLKIEIYTSNPIHKFIHRNEAYMVDIKIDGQRYEAVTLALGEQYQVYLDSPDLDKGKYNVEITVTDVSTPEIVYGRKEIEINLLGVFDEVEEGEI